MVVRFSLKIDETSWVHLSVPIDESVEWILLNEFIKKIIRKCGFSSTWGPADMNGGPCRHARC
jgi:hypothetical protein